MRTGFFDNNFPTKNQLQKTKSPTLTTSSAKPENG